MALINFDDKIVSWIKLFDDNNSALIDILNKIDNKIKSWASSKEDKELQELIKNFINWYSSIIQSYEYVLSMHSYANLEYVKYLHKIQEKNLSNTLFSVLSWKLSLTRTKLEEMKEIILNNVSWDRHAAKFLKKKYRDNVNDIISWY